MEKGVVSIVNNLANFVTTAREGRATAGHGVATRSRGARGRRRNVQRGRDGAAALEWWSRRKNF